MGAGIKPRETTVTWRQTMNYAAAVGDDNPHYFDDERAGGVVAPPAFAVALTWPIAERIWDYIEAPDFPREVLATQVHYTEHLAFHRPVVPGDRLSTRFGRLSMTAAPTSSSPSTRPAPSPTP